MSLIHGSRGLIYFVHQFSPKFDEHALLDDPEMLGMVTKLNLRIQSPRAELAHCAKPGFRRIGSFKQCLST